MGSPRNEVGVPQLLWGRNNGLSCMTAHIMVTPVWETLDSLPVIYTVSVGKASYSARENVLENQAHCGLLWCILEADVKKLFSPSTWLLRKGFRKPSA